MTGQHRVNHIIGVVEQLRERHFWTLGLSPVRWEQARRLARELSIEVMRWPIVDQAFTIGQPDGFVVVLRNDLRGRRPTQILLHEIGHTVLHMLEASGIERHLFPCKRGDPREAEAELFARLLYYGPKAGPDNNVKIADAVGAIHAAHYRRRAPEQLPLSIQERPVLKPLAEPFESERQYQRRIARRGAGKMRPIRRDEPSNADLERIEFFDAERGTARLTDVAGRRWWIYNYRIIVDASQNKRWELVRDFMSPDIEFRFFVNSLGRRQVYRFANRREQRAYRVKHLDRQLAESIYLPDRKGPVFPTARAAERRPAEPAREEQ